MGIENLLMSALRVWGMGVAANHAVTVVRETLVSGSANRAPDAEPATPAAP
jgi:hypothetical protein